VSTESSAVDRFYVGVDGCRAGWIAVLLTERPSHCVHLFPDILDLWNKCREAALILIDIPIGLPDEDIPNPRTCDVAARRLLGPARQSSVFPAPSRPAIYAKSYESGSRANERATGKRLSKQAWGIVPKIRQVEELLLGDGSAQAKIKEVHPEVCFWSLAGGKPMHYSKKSESGFVERLQVLASVYPNARKLVDQALSGFRRRDVVRDDVLDALAAALTASLSRRSLSTIPANPNFDSKGLPMQMVRLSLLG
jgi:predicted RNase H-like nuclease